MYFIKNIYSILEALVMLKIAIYIAYISILMRVARYICIVYSVAVLVKLTKFTQNFAKTFGKIVPILCYEIMYTMLSNIFIFD